jgi:hypothetical protein
MKPGGSIQTSKISPMDPTQPATFSPHPNSVLLPSIITLSSHLQLGLRRDFLPSRLPTQAIERRSMDGVVHIALCFLFSMYCCTTLQLLFTCQPSQSACSLGRLSMKMKEGWATTDKYGAVNGSLSAIPKRV